MAGVIPDSRWRKRDRGLRTTARTDREQRSQRDIRCCRTRLDHRRSRFTGGDDVEGGRTLHRHPRLAVFERTAYEHTCIDGINRRTQNCDEIVSEV